MSNLKQSEVGNNGDNYDNGDRCYIKSIISYVKIGSDIINGLMNNVSKDVK